VGVIGAGFQAHTQILAHAELFNPISINASDVSQTAMDGLISALPQFRIKRCSVQEAVASDIVCTLTPARSPVVKKGDYVSICAQSTDASGGSGLASVWLDAANLGGGDQEMLDDGLHNDTSSLDAIYGSGGVKVDATGSETGGSYDSRRSARSFVASRWWRHIP
jgi:hypothetical protein